MHTLDAKHLHEYIQTLLNVNLVNYSRTVAESILFRWQNGLMTAR